MDRLEVFGYTATTFFGDPGPAQMNRYRVASSAASSRRSPSDGARPLAPGVATIAAKARCKSGPAASN
jgi:hypothetical protein